MRESAPFLKHIYIHNRDSDGSGYWRPNMLFFHSPYLRSQKRPRLLLKVHAVDAISSSSIVTAFSVYKFIVSARAMTNLGIDYLGNTAK